MRYNDTYAKHVMTTRNEIEMRCSKKYVFMILKQHYRYLMLFIQLTI